MFQQLLKAWVGGSWRSSISPSKSRSLGVVGVYDVFHVLNLGVFLGADHGVMFGVIGEGDGDGKSSRRLELASYLRVFQLIGGEDETETRVGKDENSTQGSSPWQQQQQSEKSCGFSIPGSFSNILQSGIIDLAIAVASSLLNSLTTRKGKSKWVPHLSVRCRKCPRKEADEVKSVQETNEPIQHSTVSNLRRSLSIFVLLAFA
jgi:hypothetical protein